MKKPGFTAVPHEVIDTHLREMSCAETKVLLVILRSTFGWHRETSSISLSKLSEITGLGKSTCSEAATALEERGLIRKEHQTAQDGGNSAVNYYPDFDTPPIRPTEQGVRPTEYPIRPSEHPKEERKQSVEYNNRDTPPTPSLAEQTPPETFIRKWNSTRGLKRLTCNERKYALERWSVDMSGLDLDEALGRFAQWFKTANHMRSPVAVFLRDPQSWVTYREEPKERWPPRMVHFRGLYASTGAPEIDSDWDDAAKFCEGLTDAEWDKADAHVVTVQGAYMKSPKNYFRTREFERPPRPEPKSKFQLLMENC